MSNQIITCPNAACRASLALAGPPPPGARLRCPRCGTEFVPPPDPAAIQAAGTVPLAAEPERRCPSCRAVLAPEAVLCVACGFDLRTGQKLKGPKKARRKRAGRSAEGPLTEGDLHEMLQDAEKLIGLAEKELRRLPYVLGGSDDPDMAALRAAAGGARCANPNCQLGVDARGLLGGQRVGTSKVKITYGMKTVYVSLCESCTEQALADMAARDETARGYLGDAREELERAQRRFPRDPRIQETLREVRKVELLARAEKPGRRLCFIATAAFGGPFAAEVEALRRFRDEVLARAALGRLLTRAYEALSPPLAAWLSRSPRGRAAMRWLLRPVAALCRRRLP
jgi:hypothetical protein